MNVALPAFVIFILLIPGFIARSRIKRVERLSLDYSPFGQVVTEGLAWAFGLHFIWVVGMEHLTTRVLKPEITLKLLSSNPTTQSETLVVVAGQFDWVVLYFGTLILFSYLLPLAIRNVITYFRLDRSEFRLSGLLRFSGAPWYYLLSGADFKKDETPDMIAVSAFVDVSGEPYLFTGYLTDYFLNTDGTLDRLVLENVMRRPLGKDKNASPVAATASTTDSGPDPVPKNDDAARFYPVDGDYFVLRYSEAITLNIKYVKAIKLNSDAANGGAVRAWLSHISAALRGWFGGPSEPSEKTPT